MKWIILILLLLVGCTVAERGSSMLVTYTGAYDNGTIFDTNDPAYVGRVSKSLSQFTPLQVTLGRGQLIKGFEDALYGMRAGESKEVRIRAVDAYGAYDAEKTVTVPKRFSVPRTTQLGRNIVLPKEEFTGEATTGRVVQSQNYFYNVTGSNDTHVYLFMMNATHDPIQFDETYWNSTLIGATATAFTYEHLIEANRTYSTALGPYVARQDGSGFTFETTLRVGQEYRGALPGRVTRETDNSITVDFNHPLAGHDLIFNITVEEIR